MFNNDEKLLLEIRDKFCHIDICPWQGKRIFFENAGGALTLKSVVEISAELAAIPDNQGRDNVASHALVNIINTGKKDMHLFFGSDSGSVFVGESGTELLFRLIRTAMVGAEKGGDVIGSTLEHPASVSACTRWAEITNRNYICVPHNNQTGTVTAEDYRPYLSKNTKIATILHTSPVTGMAVDVKAIAKLIREISPDCYIIVDGIQHAAHGQVDIKSYDIDGYVISPYKVFSRHGYGVAWLSDRMTKLPHDSLIGAPAEQWEFGTRDTAAYATFSKLVEYFDWLGSKFINSDDRRTRIEAAGKAIHKHEKDLTNAMLYGVDGQSGLVDIKDINVIGGADNPAREGLVAITLKGMESSDLVAKLSEYGIRTHVRKADHYSSNILKPLNLADCVRISMCHYNSEDEVAILLNAMRKISS